MAESTRGRGKDETLPLEEPKDAPENDPTTTPPAGAPVAPGHEDDPEVQDAAAEDEEAKARGEHMPVNVAPQHEPVASGEKQAEELPGDSDAGSDAE